MVCACLHDARLTTAQLTSARLLLFESNPRTSLVDPTVLLMRQRAGGGEPSVLQQHVLRAPGDMCVATQICPTLSAGH